MGKGKAAAEVWSYFSVKLTHQDGHYKCVETVTSGEIVIQTVVHEPADVLQKALAKADQLIRAQIKKATSR